jgi:hypothetical protein
MNHMSHLTDDEIERYMGDKTDPSEENGPFEAHIGDCDLCRRRLLQRESQKLGVLEIGGERVAAPCNWPSEELLQAFAAGVCSPEEATKVFQHVADCDHCAPLLKDYLATINEEPEHNEEPGTEPAPNKGKDLLTRLSPKRKISFSGFGVVRESFQKMPVFLRAALGSAVILLSAIPVVPPAMNAIKLKKAESAIVTASKETPLKMRLSWAPHPQPTLLKDPNKPPSPADSPPLALAAQLASENQNSTDPRWIRLRGRVKLVLGDEDATKLLTIVTEMGLNDPDTEIDLAVADFQRDTQSAGKDTDDKTAYHLSESLELLTKVLRNPKLTPNQRATALFDLAMVYQRMRSWDQAVLTWEKYLELDTAGPWHDDAMQQLEEARKNVLPPKPQGYRAPGFFLNHSADTDVRASIEDYLDIALREWLSSIDDAGQYEASLALGTLAELMENEHGDSWTRDFLAARRAGDLPALSALSDAISSNRHGRYQNAEKRAMQAAELFTQLQNRPGRLRARFEAVYANQRLLLEQNCLQQAEALDKELLETRYQWLRIQVALEQAVCLNFKTRVREVQDQITKAGQSATASSFPILNLRVQALDAAIQISHNCDEAWQKAQAGLELYWRGASSPLRLNEFYSSLKQCLEKKRFWNAAEALERRMIAILEKEIDRKDENVLLEVTAHRALEHILIELDEPAEAADQAQLAIQLLARVEPPLALRYAIPIKLELADLQLDHDDAETARNTIQEVEKDVQKTGNHLVRLTFLRVRGDVNLRRQQFNKAEEDYKKGIEIAEGAVRELKTEEQRRRWMAETGDLYRGLVEVFMHQNRNHDALQLWEWYQSRSFISRNSGADWSYAPAWPEIERAVLSQPLPSGETPRLVYTSTRDGLLIWTFDRLGTKTTWVPVKRGDLQRKIQEYVRKIGREQRAELPLPPPEEESKELFTLVLQPVLADLSTFDTVTVDFDVAMNGLLVEALMSPAGWYFGQRYPVIYSPGYLRENELRKSPQQVPSTGLLLDALGDKGLRKKFEEVFPQVIVVADAAGSPAERPSLLARSQIFVFVGHGRSGALILMDGKPLKAEDFPPEATENMQLAVLVACSSAVSREGLLDTANLVHAFQSGGTPNVIASQWNVAPETTKEFMKSFLIHLKDTESPARAIYEARKELFRTKNHPYYWAAFTLSGRS